MRFRAFIAASSLVTTVNAFTAPVVICPGFGNDSKDYDTPLNQAKEVGLKSVLARRGFEPENIYTVPLKRSDWVRVAGGLLDIPAFYTNNAKPTGRGYGWYIDRLKQSVDQAYEESGGEKVILMAHSAGGWLARAAMSDGVWSIDSEGETIRTSDKIQCLVTLGAIHKIPEDESKCVTRGCLKYTDAEFPGAFLSEEGVKYVTVGGTAVIGDKRKDDELLIESSKSLKDADDLYAKRGEGSAARVAFTSYEAVAGKGDIIGDGVVPFEWTQLEGARNIELSGVVHSINEAGTTIATDRWYGSENVIDRWLPIVLEETGLSKGKGVSQKNWASNLSPFADLQDWASNLMSKSEDESVVSSRRSVMKTIVTATALTITTVGSMAPLGDLDRVANAMYENAPVGVSEIIKLPSGVTYQDLREGDGDIVSEGKRVNIQWSLKRSNGYIIDSSSSNDSVPFIFVVGNTNKDAGNRAIKGLDEAIRGTKVEGFGVLSCLRRKPLLRAYAREVLGPFHLDLDQSRELKE